MALPTARTVAALRVIHSEIDACRACPKMAGTPVHGPPVASRVFLLGQAPGPHESRFGRPFAWTAGRTLFKWFEGALGIDEESFRARVYMAAVARCFPGKARGGGDRRPDPDETARCGGFIARELGALAPGLILPVGGVAIEQVLGRKVPLADVVGTLQRARYHGYETDVLCLPHPSGVSSWHRTEPGLTLLARALGLLAQHPEMRRALEGVSRVRATPRVAP